MGLFDRFKRVVKSNLNDAISKAENPEKMLNQLIIDMNTQLIDSKKSVASAIADEKRLERQMNQQASQAKEWENKARLAIKAGKDDLAKEALLRKQEYDGYYGQYKTQWQAQHDSVEKLKQSLRSLQNKIDEAQRKKNLLLARAKRVKAQKQIQNQIGTLANTSAFDAFDKMSAKVDKLEAEAEAMQELEDMSKGSGSDLDAQFAALEASPTSGDLLLEDFKKRIEDEDSSN